MKIFIVLLFSFSLGLSFFLFPIPDHGSQEFYAWKDRRIFEAKLQEKLSQVVLASDFHFSSLEIIHVGPGELSYSRKGHLLLRFVGSGKTPKDDLALSMLADFNDFPYSRFKSIFGGYVVLPKLNFIREFESDYKLKENRFMVAHPLRVTAEQKNLVLKTLRTWLIDPHQAGGYTFFSNNCVGLIKKILLEAKILKEYYFYEGYFPYEIPPLLKRLSLIEN